MPIAPVGICIRMASKLENPKPFVMIPEKAPKPPEGSAQQLFSSARVRRTEVPSKKKPFSFPFSRALPSVPISLPNPDLHVHASPHPRLWVPESLPALIPLPCAAFGTSVILSNTLKCDKTVFTALEKLGGSGRIGHEIPDKRGHT